MQLMFVYGQNCGTCHRIAPMVERICNKKNVEFEAVDIEGMKEQEVDFFNIQSLPTMIVFSDAGEPVDERSGSITPAELEDWLEDCE